MPSSIGSRVWVHTFNMLSNCSRYQAEPEYVLCIYCTTRTANTGTERCDTCYELERRLMYNSETASKIIQHLIDQKMLMLKLVFPMPGVEHGTMTQSHDKRTLTFEFGAN